MKSEEIIEVETASVACDGDGEAAGHPRVFLSLKQQESYEVICPYCSKHYRLKEGVQLHDH
ncbi:zinc-finger domain-containing protein [Terasakiella sp. SH-1]|uniref:zinc-finger domain-containing protein n=1 Tax=Terasakiella sp. SH-1 TaxID=2560057 RepID=UPI001073130A|nr:zinc-finger domain-containing protein [Terasakiella sp. SH-1]